MSTFKPQRQFNGIPGQPSEDIGGPDMIERDIDEINTMFDPSVMRPDGSVGGIGTGNLNFDFGDDGTESGTSFAETLGSKPIAGLNETGTSTPATTVWTQIKSIFTTLTALSHLNSLKVNIADIVNTLTETAAGKVLDARQGTVLNERLMLHTNNVANPHRVTKSQVGLGSVDNTSDVNKPISTAQAAEFAKMVKKDGSVAMDTLTVTGSASVGTRAAGAVGDKSLVNGNSNLASGLCSYAGGWETTASNTGSHAEGSHSTATGIAAHAEGVNARADGYASHAEGFNTNATGHYSHVEGNYSRAVGHNSHAQNEGTIAQGLDQTVIGRFNVAQGNPDTYVESDKALIIGGGESLSVRSNIFSVDWLGNVDIPSGAKYKINGEELHGADIKLTGLTTDVYSMEYDPVIRSEDTINRAFRKVQEHMYRTDAKFYMVDAVTGMPYTWSLTISNGVPTIRLVEQSAPPSSS